MKFFNVKNFGATGNGKSDDTDAFKSAFNEVNQKGCGTVYVPSGTYKITSGITVKSSNVTIQREGKSAHLVYIYEQKENDTPDSASLISFHEGVEDITVKNLKMEYKGFFFPKFGQSYSGKVSALLFKMCKNILIKNVEICKFNANAIQVTTGDPKKYARRFKVDKCYLHHNRVAGVLFGYVDGISITNCDLEYQGSKPDGGTGYGCAGSSGELPKNIQIKGNRAFYNYRKGIDLHAGIGAVIEGNICHKNRLYGIYTEGRKTGNVIIKGNIISGMKRETVGIPKPYTWISGIDFGPYSKTLVPEEYHHYLIEGNQILDFGLKEGSAYPIRCYYNFKKGIIQIRNNIINADRITFLIGLISQSEKADRDVKVDISGNQAFIEQSTQNILQLPAVRDLNIHGNQISINRCDKDGLFDMGENTPDSFTYTNNQIRCEDSANSLKTKDHEKMKSKLYCAGNFINGKPE